MCFIIYNCKDLGTSFFSSNPLAFTKKCCTFANGTNIINMEKEYIKQHGREFMVNGIRKMGFLGVILLCSIGVSLAQGKKESKTRYYRHEISIGIGGSDLETGWSDDYAGGLMNKFGLVSAKCGSDGVVYEWNDNYNLDGGGWLYLNYYYHLNHTVAFGGYLGIFEASENLGFPEDYFYDNHQNTNIRRGYTDIKGHSVFLMPSAKLPWLNNRWCSLYSKLSAGLHFQSLYLDSEALSEEEIAPYDKSHVSLAYSVVPLGLEIGKRNIRWFMEVGIGSNTNFITGFSYRFGRY